MGEIAEGLVNGDFDFYTGEYLGEGWGFPRTAYGKKRNVKNRIRGKRFEKNTFSEKEKVNGVHYFLRDKGFKSGNEQDLVIREYAAHKEWEITGKRQILKICVKIQDDFGAFLTWFKNRVS